jgi:acetyl-CoA synthetase
MEMTSLSSDMNNTHGVSLLTPMATLPDQIRTFDEYKTLYKLSIEDPDVFWRMAAARLHWYRFPSQISNTEFDFRTERGVEIKWFEDGMINVCYNCLDRHIELDGNVAEQVAIIFEPDTQCDQKYQLTYGELLHRVKKFANVLRKHQIKKGDRVTIYMPMIVDTCIAVLACARIGVIHSVVFGGFSSHSLAERIADCDSNIVITSDFGVRGGKKVGLKSKVDQALEMPQCQGVRAVLVFQRNNPIGGDDDCAEQRSSLSWTNGKDFWIHDELNTVDDDCPCEPMNAEDPLFIVSYQCRIMLIVDI